MNDLPISNVADSDSEEGAQERFLVLAGECTLVVEEEERAMRQWDYFHCPAGTRHVLVGAGEGPCSILMLGKRPEDSIHYPVSEVAAKHGASVTTETSIPDEAYANWPGEYEPARLARPAGPRATSRPPSRPDPTGRSRRRSPGCTPPGPRPCSKTGRRARRR